MLANSEDPDQTPHMAYDLDLHSLPMTLLLVLVGHFIGKYTCNTDKYRSFGKFKRSVVNRSWQQQNTVLVFCLIHRFAFLTCQHFCAVQKKMNQLFGYIQTCTITLR